MDMFYARATNFGDDYDLADENADGVADIDPTDGEFEIFDKLEWHDSQAAEAALKANPGATLFYAIWNEFQEVDVVDEDGNVIGTVLEDSDAVVRRTMELADDGVTTPTGGDEDGGPGSDGGNDDSPGSGRDDDDRPGSGGRDDDDRPSRR
jgi:hypothetical protein